MFGVFKSPVVTHLVNQTGFKEVNELMTAVSLPALSSKA
jgi:hypothetical protein